MKEEQNHQKESEQLNFLDETTKEIANEKEKDLGVKSPLQSKDERFGILRNEHFPENILILDTETTGLDNENDDSTVFGINLTSSLAQSILLFPLKSFSCSRVKFSKSGHLSAITDMVGPPT